MSKYLWDTLNPLILTVGDPADGGGGASGGGGAGTETPKDDGAQDAAAGGDDDSAHAETPAEETDTVESLREKIVSLERKQKKNNKENETLRANNLSLAAKWDGLVKALKGVTDPTVAGQVVADQVAASAGTEKVEDGKGDRAVEIAKSATIRADFRDHAQEMGMAKADVEVAYLFAQGKGMFKDVDIDLEEGTIEGVEDVLKDLKKSRPDWFKTKTPGTPAGVGNTQNPATPDGNVGDAIKYIAEKKGMDAKTIKELDEKILLGFKKAKKEPPDIWTRWGVTHP
jgi:hypothetical protein